VTVSKQDRVDDIDLSFEEFVAKVNADIQAGTKIAAANHAMLSTLALERPGLRLEKGTRKRSMRKRRAPSTALSAWRIRLTSR